MNIVPHTLGLFLLLVCYGCNDGPKKEIPDPEGHKKDSLICIMPPPTDYCGFNQLIAEHRVTPTSQEIYLHDTWSHDEDEKMLALLDSLEAKDTLTRAFYFKVVGMTYKHSDGYYSEGLGLTGKNYIENNTAEFASYFDNKTCFTEKDLETWANIAFMEFRLMADNEPKGVVDTYTRQLSGNCKSCTQEQKQTIKKFSEILRKLWKQYLVDTEEKPA